MIYRKNALWMSLAAALFASASAMAQDAGTAAQQPATQQPATAQNQADAKKVQQLEGVTVTGSLLQDSISSVALTRSFRRCATGRNRRPPR